MAGVEVADGAGRRVCVVVCDVQNGWGDCRRRPYRVCMAGEEEEEEKKPNDRQTTRATTRRHDDTTRPYKARPYKTKRDNNDDDDDDAGVGTHPTHYSRNGARPADTERDKTMGRRASLGARTQRREMKKKRGFPAVRCTGG